MTSSVSLWQGHNHQIIPQNVILLLLLCTSLLHSSAWTRDLLFIRGNVVLKEPLHLLPVVSYSLFNVRSVPHTNLSYDFKRLLWQHSASSECFPFNRGKKITRVWIYTLLIWVKKVHHEDVEGNRKGLWNCHSVREFWLVHTGQLYCI